MPFPLFLLPFEPLTNVSRSTAYHRYCAVLRLVATFTNADFKSSIITAMCTLPFTVSLSSIPSSVPSSHRTIRMFASCTRSSKLAPLYPSPRAQAIISATQPMAASCEERAHDPRALVRYGQIKVHEPVEPPESAHRWAKYDSLLDGVNRQGDSVLHKGVTFVSWPPQMFPAAPFPTGPTLPM